MDIATIMTERQRAPVAVRARSRLILRLTARGRGVTRELSASETLAAACAALMLDAGLRRSVVKDTVVLPHARAKMNKAMVEGQGRSDDGLIGADVEYLDVGDRDHLRLRKRGGVIAVWLHLPTGKILMEFQPLVLVTIDFAGLRQRLKL